MIRSAVRLRSSAIREHWQSQMLAKVGGTASLSPLHPPGDSNMRLFFFFCLLCCGISSVTWAASGRSPSPLLEYDRGTPKGARAFQSVERCTETPCVVTQHGALRFHPDVASQYRVEVWYIHDGSVHPIGLFQQSTTFEQKLGERLLNRTPNRKIVNLTRMIETGSANTVYIYGVLLQYDVDEADPILVRLTSLADSRDVQEYYFRFHKTGPRADLDLAFIFPINHFSPNPGDTIRSANRGMAFSFSVGSHMDPDKKYPLISKLARAVRMNLMLGVVDRQLASDIAGDRVISNSVDAFAGVGLTFFDFFLAGYGYNLVRPPRSGFPFVGLEVRHVFQFIKSLKKDTHSKWEEYLRDESVRMGVPGAATMVPAVATARGRGAARFCRGAHIDRACSGGSRSGETPRSTPAQ